MNTGAISSRYATALLKFTQQAGSGARVCAQAKALLTDPDNAPQPLEPELQQFITMLVRNGRLEHVRLILTTFIRMYHESENIHMAHLTTAAPVPGLEARIVAMLEKTTGGRVSLDSSVDPSVIGGFVLDVDDYRLDASVRSQFDAIRKELIEDNNRLV